MELVLWGVRGSIASPSPETLFYGGNTTCVEVRSSDDVLCIFDAGSGLRLLGARLPKQGECHLFISHGHADHIHGLGFFQPLNNPDWTTHMYVPEWHAHLPEYFFDSGMFPLPFDSLKGKIHIHKMQPGQKLELNRPDGQGQSVHIEALLGNHPGGSLAYRMYADGHSFLYSGDHEITSEAAVVEATLAMLQNVDLALVDASYSKSDYHPGWGHACWEDWVRLGHEAGAKLLVFTHHTPDRSDKELDAIQRNILEHESESCHFRIAREGMSLDPSQPAPKPEYSDWLYAFLDELAQYKDESVILDRILAKARQLTNADAGTCYLREDLDLVFAYTHNDKLFPVDKAYKHAYASQRVPINERSIAGYTAVSGNILNLPDVRQIPANSPYTFNESFDNKTGYRTCSMLSVPFFDHSKQLLGVLQLINSLDPRNNQPRPFTENMENIIRMLARETANTLEISAILRKNVYRLLRVTEVHDPTETGPHAERVGAISAELFQCWAEKLNQDPDAIRFFKSQLRLAAMLHDLGKVGVSDTVLKKPGKLTDEEFAVMRTHTHMGSQLLSSEYNDITSLAQDIALHHHQKWNGRGYGELEGTPLAGNKIPLTARITAIADVFDALVSPRCYKAPWPFEKALALLHEEAGQHFDPQLVECFAEITETVKHIFARYPDKERKR